MAVPGVAKQIKGQLPSAADCLSCMLAADTSTTVLLT